MRSTAERERYDAQSARVHFLLNTGEKRPFNGQNFPAQNCIRAMNVQN